MASAHGQGVGPTDAAGHQGLQSLLALPEIVPMQRVEVQGADAAMYVAVQNSDGQYQLIPVSALTATSAAPAPVAAVQPTPPPALAVHMNNLHQHQQLQQQQQQQQQLLLLQQAQQAVPAAVASFPPPMPAGLGQRLQQQRQQFLAANRLSLGSQGVHLGLSTNAARSLEEVVLSSTANSQAFAALQHSVPSTASSGALLSYHVSSSTASQGQSVFAPPSASAGGPALDEELARALSRLETGLVGSWDDPSAAQTLDATPAAAGGVMSAEAVPASGDTAGAGVAGSPAAPGPSAPSATPPPTASLYVKNLPPDATELFLYQRFAPFGAILSCRVHVDYATGRCKGVGFVNYCEQACALHAMQALHGTRTPSGHKLHITLQVPRAVRTQSTAGPAGTSRGLAATTAAPAPQQQVNIPQQPAAAPPAALLAPHTANPT